jgi:hypothetical protein
MSLVARAKITAGADLPWGCRGCTPHLVPLGLKKYRSVTGIVRLIREIVRRREENTGRSVRPSETEVYCLSDTSVLVSDQTVALSMSQHM